MRILPFRFLPLLLALTPLAAQQAVPPAPVGHVLDQAQVLLPEAAANLSKQLLAAERDASVHVYLITTPSLNTTAANQTEKLEALGGQFAAQWTKGVPGVIIAFDDESGLVTVAYSKEAKDRFSELELDQTLKGPLQEIQRGGAKRNKTLDREKLENSATVVVETLKTFQQKADRKARKQWLLIIGIVCLVLLAVGFELLVASSNRNAAGAENKTGD